MIKKNNRSNRRGRCLDDPLTNGFIKPHVKESHHHASRGPPPKASAKKSHASSKSLRVTRDTLVGGFNVLKADTSVIGSPSDLSSEQKVIQCGRYHRVKCRKRDIFCIMYRRQRVIGGKKYPDRARDVGVNEYGTYCKQEYDKQGRYDRKPLRTAEDPSDDHTHGRTGKRVYQRDKQFL